MHQTAPTPTKTKRFYLVKYPNGGRTPAFFRGFMFGVPCFGSYTQAINFETVQEALDYCKGMPKSLTLELFEL